MYGAGDPRQAPAARAKVTVPAMRARKGERPLTVVTAYDFTMARLLDEGGVDALLVGDSLGMVVQGHGNTLPVTVDEICYHGRAVARGARGAHVIGDMPFMSYQVSPMQAVETAGKLMKEGAFESVKLEGGAAFAEHVFRIVSAGIPVMGHVGLTPQAVHALGGFKVQGKRPEDAEQVVRDARALEEAGAYAIVLEAIPPESRGGGHVRRLGPDHRHRRGRRLRRPGPRLLRPPRDVPGSVAAVREAFRGDRTGRRRGDRGVRPRGRRSDVPGGRARVQAERVRDRGPPGPLSPAALSHSPALDR